MEWCVWPPSAATNANTAPSPQWTRLFTSTTLATQSTRANHQFQPNIFLTIGVYRSSQQYQFHVKLATEASDAMAPTKSKKRASDATEGTKVPVKSPSTPQHNPIKKRKMGISTHQKQALIDNLQLEGMEFDECAE